MGGMTIKVAAGLLIMICLVIGPGCSAGGNRHQVPATSLSGTPAASPSEASTASTESPAPAFPQVLTDGRGARVEIRRRPERIISLSPSATELLFSVGLGPRVVGVTANCDYPPAARTRAQVGDMIINLEQVVALRPDLIVCEGSLNPSAAQRVASLQFPVLSLFSPDIAHLERSVELLGRATGNQAQAGAALGVFQARVGAIDRKVAALGKDRPLVFVEISSSPLMTAGRGTFMDELVERSGGQNLGGELGQGYFPVSLETILERNPDIILLTVGTAREVLSRPLWRHVKAVVARRVCQVDPNILVRPSLRLADGLETLYNLFHPNPAPFESGSGRGLDSRRR